MAKLHKKGGVVGYTFFLISFIFIWATWLGTTLNQLGAEYIAANSPGGLEYIFYSYLNLWVAIGLLLGSFTYFYFGGTQ